MKILIVSWYFPPANTIGAVRLSGLAEHLLVHGEDIRVLCPNNIPFAQTLETSVEPARVYRTYWREPLSQFEWLLKLRLPDRKEKRREGRFLLTERQTSNTAGTLAKVLRKLKQGVREYIVFPDKSTGWIPFATAEGERLTKKWWPDLIFASGPPFSTLLVAYKIARRRSIPLVCEFRDRWWDDPYYPPTRLCTLRQRLLERRIAGYACGLTTVSEPWAETYRARYGKPVQVIYNGYDAEGDRPTKGVPAAFPVATLNVIYTGGIYPGRRDPRPLFRALANDTGLKSRVRIWFYGTAERHVRPLAKETGVSACIRVEPAVPHATAVKLQQRADVLLLMQWNDPREQGNVPGKLFEYLGTGRPILLLGLPGGVPDQILRERDAGVLANDSDAIARHLTRWLQLKDQTGTVPGTSPEARAGFERREQFEKLRLFLHELVGDKSTMQGRHLQ